jgi:hypothetical protein
VLALVEQVHSGQVRGPLFSGHRPPPHGFSLPSKP